MFGILAQTIQPLFAPNKLAIITHWFYGSAYFHVVKIKKHSPLAEREKIRNLEPISIIPFRLQSICFGCEASEGFLGIATAIPPKLLRFSLKTDGFRQEKHY